MLKLSKRLSPQAPIVGGVYDLKMIGELERVLILFIETPAFSENVGHFEQFIFFQNVTSDKVGLVDYKYFKESLVAYHGRWLAVRKWFFPFVKKLIFIKALTSDYVCPVKPKHSFGSFPNFK